MRQLRDRVNEKRAQKNGVVIGVGQPDDCAVVEHVFEGRIKASEDDAKAIRPSISTVHTVDFFRTFVGDPYIFGQIAANHALSDCHAMCADARTALAVVVLPFAVESHTEEMLLQV